MSGRTVAELGSVPELNEKDSQVHLYDDDLHEISRCIAKPNVCCIDQSDKYLFLATESGHLLIFDKLVGKLMKRLYCDSSAVTCICVAEFEDVVHVALGHASGTVSFIRLPSPDCPRLLKHFDMDSHKKQSIRHIVWHPVLPQVFSCDGDGLVIVSNLNFDKHVFFHSFLFAENTPCRLLPLRDVLLCVGELDISFRPMVADLESDSEPPVTYETALPIRSCVRCSFESVLISTDSDVVELKVSMCDRQISTTSIERLRFNGDRVVQISLINDHFFAIVYSIGEEQSVQLFSLNAWESLWRLDLNESLQVCTLCRDGSVIFVSDKKTIRRIGSTPPPKELTLALPPTAAHSAFSGLLGSPTKLGFSTLQKASAIVANVVGTAVEASAQSEVTKFFGDGLSRVNISSNVSAVVQTIQEYVDTTSTKDVLEGVPYLPFDNVPEPVEPLEPLDPLQISEEVGRIANPLVPVHRKAFSRMKKRVGDDDKGDMESSMQPVVRPSETDLDDDAMRSLRRQILGGFAHSDSPMLSTPPMSPRSLSSSPAPGMQILRVLQDDDPQLEDRLSETGKETSVGRETTSESEEAIAKVELGATAEEFLVPPEPEPPLSPEPTYHAVHSASVAFDILLNNARWDLERLPVPVGSSLSDVSAAEAANRSLVKKSVRINDNCDIWTEVAMPFTVQSFCVSDGSLVICHRKKKPKVVPLVQLGTKKPHWKNLSWAADSVASNDDNCLVRLCTGQCFYSTIAADTSAAVKNPIPTSGGRILEIAMEGCDLWYIAEEFGVCMLMEVPDQAIFARIDCDWPLRSIAASGQAVWAIRKDTGALVVRVGLHRCRMGYDWVEISPEGASPLVAVDVRDSTGVALDDEGNLWLVTGVDHHHPYGYESWLKVSTPWDITKIKAPLNEWTLRLTATGVLISAGKLMFAANTSFSAHRFPLQIPEKYSFLDNFTIISATSLSFVGEAVESDSIYLCRPNSEVFIYRPRRRNFTTIQLPQSACAILSLSCRGSTLSLVDSCGQLWKRGDHDAVWCKHTALKSPVSSYCEGPLCSWAVTSEGVIVCQTATDENYRLIAAPFDCDDVKPSQILCSPNGQYVWLSDGRRAWARTEVTSRAVTGLRWVETHHSDGLCSLAVGDDVVWALNEAGQLLRLKGLAAGNPSGNYWKVVSQGFRAISIDSHSCLWAINEENRLVRHVTGIHPPHVSDRTRLSGDSFELI